jgi:hypothetical protein
MNNCNWIKVEDSLPPTDKMELSEDGDDNWYVSNDEYLILTNSGKITTAFYYRDYRSEGWCNEHEDYIKATHWSEFPELPVA